TVVSSQDRIGDESGLQGHCLEPWVAADEIHQLAVAVGVALEQAEAHRALQGTGSIRDHERDLVLDTEITEAIDEVGDLLVGFDVEQLGQSLHSVNTSLPFIPETSLIVELLRCQVFGASARPSSPSEPSASARRGAPGPPPPAGSRGRPA